MLNAVLASAALIWLLSLAAPAVSFGQQAVTTAEAVRACWPEALAAFCVLLFGLLAKPVCQD